MDPNISTLVMIQQNPLSGCRIYSSNRAPLRLPNLLNEMHLCKSNLLGTSGSVLDEQNKVSFFIFFQKRINVLGGPSPVALKVYSGFLGLVYFSGL